MATQQTSTPTPRSVARLDTGFLANVEELANTAQLCGQAATGANPRAWQLPPTDAWKGDPSDIAGIAKAFDRTDANAVYGQAVLDPSAPGTVGDLVAMKAQIDYEGIMERGFRSRLASPVRCLVHASSRRIGHGDPAGVFLGGVVGYVQDVITAAKTQ